jgi:hypothetical protein
MSTRIRIDLRGKPPYYTLTKDSDRTVERAARSAGDDFTGVAGTRDEIMSNILAEREGVLDRLAVERARILAGHAREILSDLATIRQQVLESFDPAQGTGASHDQMQKIIKAQMYASHAWRTWESIATSRQMSWLIATMSSFVGAPGVAPGRV